MIALLLLFGLGAMLILVVTLVAGWQQARERAIRAEMGGGSMHAPSDLDARFGRIEQALEAIALEVERQAEAQRFLERMLSEGKPRLLPPEGGGPPRDPRSH